MIKWEGKPFLVSISTERLTRIEFPEALRSAFLSRADIVVEKDDRSLYIRALAPEIEDTLFIVGESGTTYEIILSTSDNPDQTVVISSVPNSVQAQADRARQVPALDLMRSMMRGLPVDGYEIPRRHRVATHLRTPADVFPYAGNTGRNKQLDHTIAYTPMEHGGPPGQSRPGNYGPMVGRHHRIKTHGDWQLAQPFPGIYLWRDPHGHHYLVDHTGTRKITPPAEVPANVTHGADPDTVHPGTDDPGTDNAASRKGGMNSHRGGSSQSRKSSGPGSGGNRAQKQAAGRKGGKATAAKH